MGSESDLNDPGLCRPSCTPVEKSSGSSVVNFQTLQDPSSLEETSGEPKDTFFLFSFPDVEPPPYSSNGSGRPTGTNRRYGSWTVDTIQVCFDEMNRIR